MTNPDPIAATFTGVREALRELRADGWITAANVVEKIITDAMKATQEPAAPPKPEEPAWKRSRCCNGTGMAAHASVPCPDPDCPVPVTHDPVRKPPPERTEYGARNKKSANVYGPMSEVEAVDLAEAGGGDWEVVERTVSSWTPTTGITIT